MLKVTDLQVSYGGIHAIRGVNFEVKQGEIVTLVGSNGAGKTSILRAISNLIKSQGSIHGTCPYSNRGNIPGNKRP